MYEVIADALRSQWLAIVFAVGARQADSISSRGHFFSTFVVLIGALQVMYIVSEHVFHTSGGAQPYRFGGLIWFIGAVMALSGAVVAFMLSRTIKSWSDTEFLGNVLDSRQLVSLSAVFLLGAGFIRLVARYHAPASEHVGVLARAICDAGIK
jgi:hypothetical protein